MKHQIEFPYVAGVSAGACNAVDYVSGQIGRTKACVITEDKNNSYIGLKQTLKNKTLFDMDMLFERYPNEIFPFDYDAYFNSGKKCELVVTDCITGQAKYLEERNDRKRLMDICRASSSIPLVCPMVMIDGIPCVDGRCSRFHSRGSCHEGGVPQECGDSYQELWLSKKEAWRE